MPIVARKAEYPLRLQPMARFRRRPTRGAITCGDALQFLRQLPDRSADLVFLDPPFNLGKEYSIRRPGLDARPEAQYRDWLNSVVDESVRILSEGGALYVYHLPIWAMRVASRLDATLTFRHWIAVSMKNGFARGMRLYPAHYALLMFTRGTPLQFRRPLLRPQVCRHCGKLIKDYGGYRSIIESKGLNLSDVWDDLSPVRHRTVKTRRANELPRTLFSRIFAISGRKGGLYVDPFGGSGAGVIAAVQAGMTFACCDLLRTNCTLITRRVVALSPKGA